MLPLDPDILFSYLNMKLRDSYDSLEALCDDLDEDPSALLARLEAAGFTYDPAQNRLIQGGTTCLQ